ncbi:coatomer subunit gamma-2-like [Hyalella azteca]|uniref:Coatomer subunit gamma-2-like n=1 Tax=Hyalella azteca TaxID=294128 RepID=A0A8B7NZE3_HYAAZ|nr:coatomer subunit gamma-2-like [Hyalella azteca]
MTIDSCAIRQVCGLDKSSFAQFDCTNTLNDQLLEDVSVVVEEDGSNWQILQTLPCASLPYSCPGTCYVLLAIPEDIMSTTGTFTACLKFQVRDCDPITGEPETEDGYGDDYTVKFLYFVAAFRSNF